MIRFGYTPIIPLEFDASLSYLEQIECLKKHIKKQGLAINEIATYLGTLDIDQKIKDEVLRQFITTPSLRATLLSHKYLFVGDSYLAGSTLTNPSTENYGAILQSEGFDITPLHSAGGGFSATGVNGKFSDLLSNYVDTHTAEDCAEFTDILFLGGINDATITDIDRVGESMIYTVNYAHQHFPNAIVHIGYISQANRIDATYGGGLIYQANKVKQRYREACFNCRASYITNSEFMLKNSSLIHADGIHPTALGQRYIATYLTSYLINGNISTMQSLYSMSLLTEPSRQIIDPDCYIKMLQKDNIVTITNHGTMVWRTSGNIETTPIMELSGNTAIIVGTFPVTVAVGISNSNTEFGECSWTVPATITLYDSSELTTSKTYNIALTLEMVGQTLFARPMLVNDVADQFLTKYVKQINVPPFSAVISADWC